jgi:hypothetical protein
MSEAEPLAAFWQAVLAVVMRLTNATKSPSVNPLSAVSPPPELRPFFEGVAVPEPADLSAK